MNFCISDSQHLHIWRSVTEDDSTMLLLWHRLPHTTSLLQDHPDLSPWNVTILTTSISESASSCDHQGSQTSPVLFCFHSLPVSQNKAFTRTQLPPCLLCGPSMQLSCKPTDSVSGLISKTSCLGAASKVSPGETETQGACSAASTRKQNASCSQAAHSGTVGEGDFAAITLLQSDLCPHQRG